MWSAEVCAPKIWMKCLALCKIPQLWQLFQNRVVRKKNTISEPIGIYHNYESDHNGMYTLLAGVRSLKKRVEELESVTIPAGKVFKVLSKDQCPFL